MKTYTLDSADWPLILNDDATGAAVATFDVPPGSSGDDAEGLASVALARVAAVAPRMLRALEWATAYVGLYTGDGASNYPDDVPRAPNGFDFDAEAIAKECRAALKAARGET